jgi:hypothetical protein
MLPRLAVPLCLASALLLAGPGATLLAQEAETPAPAAQPALAIQPPPAAKPGSEAKPAAAPAPARRGQLTNIRVDVKITDIRSGQAPITKTVSVTVADRRQGMVRSIAGVPTKTGYQRLPLNVDAKPAIEEGKIRLELTVDYNIAQPDADATPPAAGAQPPSTEVRQYAELVLESGKSMTISESADAFSDRRVKLEVTATIL